MSKTVFTVTASYSGKFKSAKAAGLAAQKLKQNPRAIVTTKKLATGYLVSVRYKFVTPSASVRDKAISGAKAQGAKISVTSKKV